MFNWLLGGGGRGRGGRIGSSTKGVSMTDFDPRIAALVQGNDYALETAWELEDSEDDFQELAEANMMLAQKLQETAELMEVDRQLTQLVKLDEEGRKAKVNIQKNLAEHMQSIAKTNAEMAAIQSAHVVSMAGHLQSQQMHHAQLNGIVAARATIAARLRGR